VGSTANTRSHLHAVGVGPGDHVRPGPVFSEDEGTDTAAYGNDPGISKVLGWLIGYEPELAR
jgi:hypothetical protein